MSEKEVQDLLMVGKFMEISHLFPFQSREDENPIGIYKAEDEHGMLDYIDGINWYSPDSDWNELMNVCKKIIGMYFDKREDIFAGLKECDIKKTYKACVDFIHFWNDDKQIKIEWNN